MTRTIVITGARGGQGTTTVAAAIALLASQHQSTVLASNDPAATAALVGVPLAVHDEWVQVTDRLVLSSRPDAHEAEFVVVDAGVQGSYRAVAAAAAAGAASDRYTVLRGPCYVALATVLTAAGARPDGVILVAEDKRSLTARDVVEVLDVPVVATVVASPTVARTIDAGLLLTRLPHLRELAPLRPLADPAARSSTDAHRKSLKKVTDLPFPQSGNRVEGRAVRSGCPDHVCGAHVGRVWDTRSAPHAEHRSARARRRRVLPGRDRLLGRGLLHRPRRVGGTLGRLPRT